MALDAPKLGTGWLLLLAVVYPCQMFYAVADAPLSVNNMMASQQILCAGEDNSVPITHGDGFGGGLGRVLGGTPLYADDQ